MKTTVGLGRGRRLTESSSYAPSREASEGNSVSLPEERNEEQSMPQGQSEPVDVPSTFHSTYQVLKSDCHESNVAAPGSNSDDAPDDDQGGASAQAGMARTKKKVV